jgi:hypothetical protein
MSIRVVAKIVLYIRADISVWIFRPAYIIIVYTEWANETVFIRLNVLIGFHGINPSSQMLAVK